MVEEQEIIRKFNLEIVERNAWLNICKAASEETIKNLGLHYFELGSSGASMIPAIDTLALNRVIGFGLDYNTDNEILERIIEEFKSRNIPRFFLQISPEILNDTLKSRLNAHNFIHYNNWVKLHRSADKPLKEYDSDFIVEQVGNSGAGKFSEILVRSFEWDTRLSDLVYDFISREYSPAKDYSWIFYLGYYKNKPVSVASLYIEGDYCWLGFAATLKEYRGLGAQHALIRQRILDGLNNGCKHFIVETAENLPAKRSQSYLNLVDMGFELFYTRPNYIFYNKY